MLDELVSCIQDARKNFLPTLLHNNQLRSNNSNNENNIIPKQNSRKGIASKSTESLKNEMDTVNTAPLPFSSIKQLSDTANRNLRPRRILPNSIDNPMLNLSTQENNEDMTSSPFKNEKRSHSEKESNLKRPRVETSINQHQDKAIDSLVKSLDITNDNSTVRNENNHNRFSSLQPIGDELVTCPICSQNLKSRALNQHLDQNCPKEDPVSIKSPHNNISVNSVNISPSSPMKSSEESKFKNPIEGSPQLDSFSDYTPKSTPVVKSHKYVLFLIPVFYFFFFCFPFSIYEYHSGFLSLSFFFIS